MLTNRQDLEKVVKEAIKASVLERQQEICET
jgi:hypothetical protein